jgi:hypothetical protein
MTRIAPIGGGHWGRNFARVLAEKNVPAAICDTDAAVAGPIAGMATVPNDPPIPIPTDLPDRQRKVLSCEAVRI